MAALVLVACVLLGSIRRRVDMHRLAPTAQPGPTIHPPLQQHAPSVQQARTIQTPEAHLQQHAPLVQQARTIHPSASQHAPHV